MRERGMVPPCAVTFDLWATLLTSPAEGSEARHQQRVEALGSALSARGDEVAAEAISQMMRDEWARYNRVWREEARTMRNAERLEGMLEALGLAPLSLAASRQVCQAFDDSLWAGPPSLVEGGREVLEGLSRGGVRLGVISDTSFSTGRTLRALLEREGVLSYFDAGALIFSDEVGRSKPHGSLFERALASLDVIAAVGVHVGDNEHTDITGALEAGMTAVRYAPEGAPESAADHVVERFEELLTLLLPWRSK